MSSATCCMVAQLMFITMLVTTEGRRMQQVRQLGDAFTSREAFTGPGRAGNKRSNAGDSDTSNPRKLPMDMPLNDPAVKEQLVAIAGHMDAFAKKAPAALLARAERMANEMFKLSIDSSSSAEADSSLAEDMAAMLADHNFQQQAQEFAKTMQKNAKVGNTDFHGELQATVAALSSQQTSSMFSESVKKGMTGIGLQEFSRQMSEALRFLMLNPEMLKQAKSLAGHLEPVRDSQNLAAAEKVSKQVDATIANMKFKAMPFVVVRTSAETKNSSESGANDKFLEELNALAEKSTKELFAAMEAMGSTPEVADETRLAPSGSKPTPEQGVN